jgi:hypothetical protein
MQLFDAQCLVFFGAFGNMLHITHNYSCKCIGHIMCNASYEFTRCTTSGASQVHEAHHAKL